MSTVKDWLEITYYVAFIVLTWLIVWYAKKTYLFQVEASSSLYCKLLVPVDDLGKNVQRVFLEIYNHGNTPAKDVSIILNGKELATIDYIRSEDCATIIVGEVCRYYGGNVLSIQDEEIEENAEVPISIAARGHARGDSSLQTRTLFLRSRIVQEDNAHIANAVSNVSFTLEKIYNRYSADRTAIEVSDLNKTIGKAFDCHNAGLGHATFRDELCKIANEISKSQNRYTQK